MTKQMAILAKVVALTLAVSPAMAKPGATKARTAGIVKVDSDDTTVGLGEGNLSLEESCRDPHREDNTPSSRAGIWRATPGGQELPNPTAVLIQHQDGSYECVKEVFFVSCGNGNWSYADPDSLVDVIVRYDSNGNKYGGVPDAILSDRLMLEEGINKVTVLQNHACEADNPIVSTDTYNVKATQYTVRTDADLIGQ